MPNRTSLAGVLVVLVAAAFAPAQSKVEVTNNQPFPIAMPLKLLDGGRTVMLNVEANGKQTIDLPAKAADGAAKVSVEPAENGVRLKSGDRDLGVLSWDILFEKLAKEAADDEIDKTQRDFDKLFKPLPLKFASSGKSDLFETFSAESSKHGVKLEIDLDVYRAGFVDVRATLTNESAPETKVYASVLTRWQQPKVSSRTVNYNNDPRPLNAGDATPFRKGGSNARQRHMVIQRGVDWINTSFDNGSVAMLNDFAPSFTVHKEARGKTPAHWTGANSAHLGQEAVVVADKLYSITEIAARRSRCIARGWSPTPSRRPASRSRSPRGSSSPTRS
jgi:hypothetical protein